MITGTSQRRDTYQNDAVSTAGPAQLIQMLYDRTLTAVSRSEVALAADPQDIDTAHQELTRAQDIVMELALSLDHEQGGPIAASMSALYDFCHRTLVNANASKDPAQLNAVAKVIGDLRSAWVEACLPESLT